MQHHFAALLTDVEGTTTSLDFVKNVLFPYAANNSLGFLQRIIDLSENEKSDQFRQLIIELINLSNESTDPKIVKISSSKDLGSKLASNVQRWTQQDRKLTALKKLQGLIWEEGYRNGSLQSHVFPDVPKAFQTLSELGIPIFIFSSGSVHAQRLLFSHTQFGDISKFISGYFDTETGPKFESDSYQNIAKQINCPVANVMFLTDAEKEAVSADEAGLQVRLFVREGNAPLSEDAAKKFKTLESFQNLLRID
ncbi:hypothetical protein niasHT_013574 [Heterodera trifolii]|uniref:Enolase-phosphatase E1 n=1 Tax=Heterodera trifolii TaxID=157864 RepID=A0ABD2LE86_9BILA